MIRIARPLFGEEEERAVLEVRFPYSGRYMFHAHQSEFTELGWVGAFEVTADGV